MNIIRNAFFATGIATLSALALAHSANPTLAETMPLSALHGHTHIHGLSVDRADSAYLLIATHHGLFRTGPDGVAERISIVQDFMGFNPHPTDANTLFASGHPAEGGNLGFIASADGGKTWTEVSPGINGPVDFHQMTVSSVDPNKIYGAFRVLQVSEDAGKTWKLAGPLPDKLIDLAASAKDADTLYAAQESGLSVSTNGGLTWKPLIEGSPVTMVEVTADGIYAFVIGTGLVKAEEGMFKFSTLNSDWGPEYILHLAADPSDPKRIYAATGNGAVLASKDQGQSWAPFSQ